MTLAVDTSVLITIARGEADATAWIDVLAAALEEGDLVICDVAVAELFAVLLDADKFREILAACAKDRVQPHFAGVGPVGRFHFQTVPARGRSQRASHSRLSGSRPRANTSRRSCCY